MVTFKGRSQICVLKMAIFPMPAVLFAQSIQPLVHPSSCEEWGKPFFRLFATLQRCSGLEPDQCNHFGVLNETQTDAITLIES